MKNTPYYWLNTDSKTFLKRGYLLDGETPEERFKQIAETAETLLGMPGYAEKFLDFFSRGWYSLSTPILANFGRERALGISCYGTYIPDTTDNILGNKFAEVVMMTKCGGGTSTYWGDVRGRGAPISSGGNSSGTIPFMEVYEKMMNTVTQGVTRRGSLAVILPIDHPDIEEFLSIKDVGHSIQDLSIGVCVSDEYMQKIIDGDKPARKIWGKVIKKRFETGYPYVFFSDNVNNQAPQVYKDKGLKINHSNLCQEICLSNSADESFVCDLSSMNLLHYDEWKDTDAIYILICLLDAVMTEFINKTEHIPFMGAARNFAINQRALGVGVLGWHSYLQSKMVAFESFEAKLLNSSIWKNIRMQADEATEKLAEIYGEPPLLTGYKRRNVTTLAIAPTTSSSFILGQVSPSIEPLNSNYFTKNLAKIKATYINPYLKKLLKTKEQDTDEVWKSILVHGGSVQHLDFLNQEEKDVFKTFGEISQKEIIIQAAQRQKFIDQGQSLNLMISADAKVKDVNALMIFAWEQGIKTLYYQRSVNVSQELARNIMNCKSCEG